MVFVDYEKYFYTHQIIAVVAKKQGLRMDIFKLCQVHKVTKQLKSNLISSNKTEYQ